MQNPLQITFHDLEHNHDIEAAIDEKFTKLKMVSPDITKCHVVLEGLSKHHQKANLACVRLDLKVSHFDDIVISEKCTSDAGALKTATLKVFKIALVRVREELKRRQHNKRAPRKDFVSETVEVSEEE